MHRDGGRKGTGRGAGGGGRGGASRGGGPTRGGGGVLRGKGLKRLPPVGRNGETLWDYLTAALGCSRRAAKALLDDRVVWVNGRRIWMAKHLLQTRDVVELTPGAVAGGAAVQKIPVLAEGEGWLVADKPAGLQTTGAKSLETRLQEQTGQAGLRAVHRLDKDTTGCVLFAKNEAARRALVKEFEEGKVRKLYHALAVGAMEDEAVDLRERIEGQSAVSHVWAVAVRKRPPRATHVRVGIETGRTHQIRIHLSQYGHPVLGDRQYFTAASAAFNEVPRQMLHAHELRFEDPDTGEGVKAVSPLPKDFREWMKRLGIA